MTEILVIILIAVFILFLLWKNKKSAWKSPTTPFPKEWRIILIDKVVFYNALSMEEKNRFEHKIQEFLLNCRITGINVEVNLTDKILVASSAIIPIFAFPEWKYTNLFEVLL
ncbi:hypothetical protein BZG02_00005 [Labilibaculum filiforme]|uniref:Uncharacterized protein n=1 Tax=Labilibaculum filiforme TaxID=1940526 RepID=A0A2N3I543_9BACT|nr:zinc-dependent peptidase [Labilibaculum filiforme]PKQ65425.1 hypothetical protein BZG02_00005 [Labilibaculum filiforme]